MKTIPIAKVDRHRGQTWSTALALLLLPVSPLSPCSSVPTFPGQMQRWSFILLSLTLHIQEFMDYLDSPSDDSGMLPLPTCTIPTLG